MDVVDIISTDPKTGHVVLSISDHLEWTDSVGHQTILQEKLNKYLAFVESGEILERYPDAQGRPIRFRVFFKYAPDGGGETFMAKARGIIEGAGFSLVSEVSSDPS
jgi:hypothetical protein